MKLVLNVYEKLDIEMYQLYYIILYILLVCESITKYDDIIKLLQRKYTSFSDNTTRMQHFN